MIPLKKILIPHDFSICSSRVLDYGIELAVKTASQLHFLYVNIYHEPSLLDKTSEIPEAEQLREKLDGDIYESLQRQGLKVSSLEGTRYVIMEHYAAAPAIVQYCAEHDIDLVIIGTHGRRGMERSLRQAEGGRNLSYYHLGSVTEEVVHTAPCSVFTLREQAMQGPFAEQLQKITVPIDFSDQTLDSLLIARQMAAAYEAALEVVHVVEKWEYLPYYGDDNTLVFEGEEVEQKALERMHEVYDRAEGPRVDVDFVVRNGHPVHEILAHTEESGSDLIVIASHGLRSTSWKPGVGGTVEQLVRAAPCPVFVLKEAEPAKSMHSTMTTSYSTLSDRA